MKKIIYFFVIGGLQFALDTSLFTILVYFSAGVVASNFISRGCAALVGYYLNGKFTFRKKLVWKVFFRFVLYWMLMTTASTACLYFIKIVLHGVASSYVTLLSKILVELLMFLVSFLIAKYWVYKK